MLVNWTGGEMATWRYYVAIYFMYATGYPIGHTAVLTWFSKLSKQSSEGFLQGWFGSAVSSGVPRWRVHAASRHRTPPHATT